MKNEKPTITRIEKPDAQINEKLEDKRFEYFLKRYLDIMNDKDVPDYCKLLLQQPDIMLVASKLKPATDVEFITPYWDVLKESGIIDETKVAQFKKVMSEKFNVLSTETNNRFDGKFFLVYNPKLIDQRIKTEFPELEPWPKDNDLNGWFEANIQKGVSHHTLKGLYYGFPKSAINNWLKTLASEQNTVNEETQTIFSPGETYIVPKGELSEDVKTREKEKDGFLKRVKESNVINKEQDILSVFKEKLLQLKPEIKRRIELDRKKI
jgi:hypothetical protein